MREPARRRHWGRITISRSETRAQTPIPEWWAHAPDSLTAVFFDSVALSRSGAGYAPGGAVTFFRVAERKSPKKGRPRCPCRFLGSEPQFTEPAARPKGAVLRIAVKWVSDPNNRNLRCSLQAGSAQTRLAAQTARGPDPPEAVLLGTARGEGEPSRLSGHRCAWPRRQQCPE